MQVILLDKIGKLGNLGDQVSVKAGFGRNYLLPYGLAVPATAENQAAFEAFYVKFFSYICNNLETRAVMNRNILNLTRLPVIFF